MTTLLEILISFLAPNECFLCGIENNIACRACVFELVDDTMCKCHVCGLPSSDYRPCVACSQKTHLDGLFVLGAHDDEIKRLVLLLKFEGRRQVASDISPALASLLPRFEQPPLVTHLPTAYVRERQRGFDQARLLAQALARTQKWRKQDVFRRVGDTRQVGSSKKVRRLQAETMFKLRNTHIFDQSVLLVDDVVTTGASMEAAAKLLKEAGASEVYGVAVARTSSGG